MRKGREERTSEETEITINLLIEGKGEAQMQTPIQFLNHMLAGFTKHGLFNIEIHAKGDLEIDQHHTIEDLGIVLGKTFKKALHDMKGINRAGSFAFPMDESLGIVAVDISGRPHCVFKAKFQRRMCGDLDTDLVEDFFAGFSMGCNCNIAIYVPYGRNDHHKLEAIFKAFGKSMKMACEIQDRAKNVTPSTKGVIDFVEKQ
ncbi:MAG: imidazoleglycerol-phosphate dehydratase HisB [Nanoarchaeota archaeon]